MKISTNLIVSAVCLVLENIIAGSCMSMLNRQSCTREKKKEPAGLNIVGDAGTEAAGSSFMCCNLLQFRGTSIIPKDGIRGALRSSPAFWHRVLRRRPHPGRRRCQSDAWLLSWALGGKSCLTSPQ